MLDFKGRHFEGEVVLWAVRWYCRYGVSYRDLEQMMGERGVSVDHSTIYRWVQTYAPEIEKRLRWQWRAPRSTSWRVDETYVKVRGQWAYLYRAVDKHGDTIDFYLSPTRNTAAAKRFLGKALSGLKDWETPTVINTDKALTYAAALAELKEDGKCPKETPHRQIKYLNNIIEADHGKLKQLIRPVQGFKTLKTAYATIKGFEVMRALGSHRLFVRGVRDGFGEFATCTHDRAGSHGGRRWAGMGKLLITAIAIAATPAVVAAQTPERWFATGTLPGSSNVIGPFRTLGACDEARHEASVNSHAVAVEFALQAGVLDDHIHSHQNRSYEQDLDETRRADTLRALSNQYLVTADFWKNYSLCGKR